LSERAEVTRNGRNPTRVQTNWLVGRLGHWLRENF